MVRIGVKLTIPVVVGRPYTVIGTTVDSSTTQTLTKAIVGTLEKSAQTLRRMAMLLAPMENAVFLVILDFMKSRILVSKQKHL